VVDRRALLKPAPALRTLVTMRVSQIKHCSFRVDINSATPLKRGTSMDMVAALADWRASGPFSTEQRLAVEHPEAMTLPHPGVEMPSASALKQRHPAAGQTDTTRSSQSVWHPGQGHRRLIPWLLDHRTIAMNSGLRSTSRGNSEGVPPCAM
jgi:hypothetical protein